MYKGTVFAYLGVFSQTKIVCALLLKQRGSLPDLIFLQISQGLIIIAYKVLYEIIKFFFPIINFLQRITSRRRNHKGCSIDTGWPLYTVLHQLED